MILGTAVWHFGSGLHVCVHARCWVLLLSVWLCYFRVLDLLFYCAAKVGVDVALILGGIK